jgi:arabinose-5-phosphate isomerase
VSREVALQVLAAEADAIRNLMENLGEDFDRAVELIDGCGGRVVLTGMGKSGIICRKIAATMRSTGTPALFMHPAEAIHGDLGMVAGGDLVVAISNSGTTDEILNLVAVLRRIGVVLIAITSNPESPLATTADLHLDVGVRREACPMNLAPTASTTAALALGDALAMSVSVKKGFKEEDFARLHPGGKLGKRFLKVRDLMHTGDEVPRVDSATKMKDVIYEMSRKGLGLTTVQDEEGRLLGLITDGDLRRLMEKDPDPMARTAGEVMHRGGASISPEELATAALRVLEDRRITSLMVSDGGAPVLGVLHIHDLWGVGLF